MADMQRGLVVPPDLNKVTVNGAQLSYRERGSGDPVVFVHGSISDLTIWDPTIEAVAEHFRAIAYSRRYAWPNADIEDGAKDYMQPHVDDLYHLLTALDATPAHLVGNSWGAFICLRLAIQHPEAVRRLVLQEPPLIPLITGAPPSPVIILRSLVLHPQSTAAAIKFAATDLVPMRKLAESGDIRASIDRFASAVLGRDEFAALPDEFRAHMYANAGTHVAQAIADGGFEPLSAAQIASVSHPALVMTGETSPVVLRLLAARLHRLLANSHAVDIKRASHVMNVQNPQDANAAIVRFLTE